MRYQDFWDSLPEVSHIPIAYSTSNLGDDIQSVAAQNKCGVDQFVDRDRPDTWPKDAVVPLIGWFAGAGARGFPPQSRCVVVSLHIEQGSREVMSSRKVVDWLKAGVRDQGFPAMARDISTRDFLRHLGVESEFGGCVTQTFAASQNDRNGTLVIDVNDRRIEGARDTHWRPHLRCLPPRQRLAEAQAQIERLRHTETVHTTRLHVLLPCRAMGTNVKFYPELVTYRRDRFSGHFDLSAFSTTASHHGGSWKEKLARKVAVGRQR